MWGLNSFLTCFQRWWMCFECVVEPHSSKQDWAMFGNTKVGIIWELGWISLKFYEYTWIKVFIEYIFLWASRGSKEFCALSVDPSFGNPSTCDCTIKAWTWFSRTVLELHSSLIVQYIHFSCSKGTQRQASLQLCFKETTSRLHYLQVTDFLWPSASLSSSWHSTSAATFKWDLSLLFN